MSKKIIVSTLLGASLSFATWGYFPLQESDSGLQVRANHYIGFGDSDTHYFNADVRYVLGTSLEIALLNVGFQISDPSGLQNPVLSARYQLGEKSLVFAEYALPIGLDVSKYNDNFETLAKYVYTGVASFLQLGYQHAFVLKPRFSWSSEIGYKMFFSESLDDGTINPASRIHIATELDFNSKPSFIWFAGANLEMPISSSELEDNYYGYTYTLDDDFNIGFKVFGGASLELSKGMFIQEEVSFMLIPIGDTYTDNGLAFKTSLKYAF